MNPNILRKIDIKKVQKAVIGKQTIFSKVTVKNKATIFANVNVFTLIAKERNPFGNVKFVKKCILRITDNICSDIVDKLKKALLSLSAQTITRRIEDFGDNLFNQLIQINQKF